MRASLVINREAGALSRMADGGERYPTSALPREPSWKLSRCGGKGTRFREPEQARDAREWQTTLA
jgi:hypothetical protein